MPLKPDVQALLDQFEAQGLPPFNEMSVPQARDVAGAFRDLQGEPEPVAQIRDILVPGPAGELPVRIYHPAPGTALPLLVYFHGGGWVIGNIEVVDKPCRALANASRCVVASTEYRLSPETKFPGPVEDCYAATRWAADRARSNLGPTLIEFFTYRVEGHSTSDDPSVYRPQNAGAAWPLGDPVERLKRHLVALGEWDEERHKAQAESLEAEVRAAQKEAEKLGTLQSDPYLDIASMFEDVFEHLPWHLREQQAAALAEAEAKRK
jgi:hypothetical protein